MLSLEAEMWLEIRLERAVGLGAERAEFVWRHQFTVSPRVPVYEDIKFLGDSLSRGGFHRQSPDEEQAFVEAYVEKMDLFFDSWDNDPRNL